jgi:hypothetical protein
MVYTFFGNMSKESCRAWLERETNSLITLYKIKNMLRDPHCTHCSLICAQLCFKLLLRSDIWVAIDATKQVGPVIRKSDFMVLDHHATVSTLI